MERTARQAALARLWNVAGLDSLVVLLTGAPAAREHELVHALHEQAVECQRTAPDVASRLDRIAGWLAEIHAGLRAAQDVQSVRELLRWQAEATWRASPAMQQLLAAAAVAGDEPWPWAIGRLTPLQLELEDLVLSTRRLAEVSAADRRVRFEGDRRLAWPELTAWLSVRMSAGDAEAGVLTRAHDRLVALQRLRAPAATVQASGRLEISALSELVGLWYRADATLDGTCKALRAEVVAGQRSLADAMRTVAAASDPAGAVYRRSYLLHHLLEERAASVRRAALTALARQVMSREGLGLQRVPRATLILRWASALELHWSVLPEPPVVLDAAMRAVDQILTTVADGSAPRLARDLMLTRARLLRRLVGWREDQREEGIRAYHMALEMFEADPHPVLRGRTLGELAGLLRSRRAPAPEQQDREVRAMYDQALDQLPDSVVLRARVLADYAVYLARPLSLADDDAEHAVALAEQAATLVEALPQGVLEHPAIQADAAGHRLTLANVRLEVGGKEPESRRAMAQQDYARALDHIDEGDELLAGLVHLDRGCLALSWIRGGRREERLAEAREALDIAVRGLTPLPVAHARAIAERAMLTVQADPDDAAIRERAIREVEAALHRLTMGADPVVRARAQHQLGALYFGRRGTGDLARAAEHFVAARAGFVEGGAARLAVEAARDYAESQLREYASDGDSAALLRGSMVLEQAALLAERRWASRRSAEPTDELVAMLDGVHGDLAWFQAKLGRPSPVLLRTVCQAKRYRPHPSLRALRSRAGRSAMLSPAHLDPSARRLPAPPRSPRPDTRTPIPATAALAEQLEAFGRANPDVLALDLTLTRWGMVVVAVSHRGVSHAAIPLTRRTVRGWVWGDRDAPGWWRRYLTHRESALRGRPEQASEHERAWVEASGRLVADLGTHLLEPIARELSITYDAKIVLLAPGRLTGLPLAAARIGNKTLVQNARGLAQISSLAMLPAGPLPSPRPRRALCVLASPQSSSSPLEELGDVVRLLASGKVDVEVLARHGDAVGDAACHSAVARIRERVAVAEQPPTIDAVLQRAGHIDHLFYGGHGRAHGLMMFDASGRPARLDAAAIAAGPRWRAGSSVYISAATQTAPPVDDAATWSLVEAFHRVGVGSVVVATAAVSPALAREVSRSLYLYWALGKSLPEAYCAALTGLGGFDLAGTAAFVVALGNLRDPSP